MTIRVLIWRNGVKLADIGIEASTPLVSMDWDAVLQAGYRQVGKRRIDGDFYRFIIRNGVDVSKKDGMTSKSTGNRVY